MAYELCVIQGNAKGAVFEIKDKLFLSRSRGDIVLDDPKVSNQHAQIQKRGAKYYLIDNHSSNGVIVEGHKVEEVELKEGLEFQVGKTLLRVQKLIQTTSYPDEKLTASYAEENQLPSSLDETADLSTKTRSWSSEAQRTSVVSLRQTSAQPAHSPPQAAPHFLENSGVDLESTGSEKPTSVVHPTLSADPQYLPDEPLLEDNEELKEMSPIDKINTMEGKHQTWESHLYEISHLLAKASQNQPIRPIVPLDKLIRLEFFRGLQADTIWRIGYAPRKAGSKVLDCNIQEPGAPGVCFEIIPSPKGTLFLTNHPKLVLYNGRSTSSQLIQDGDEITIIGTHIRVKVENEDD
ncbi:MAG: FHA domain-containing protein [Bdellovibrionales bacterium]|nr:FHA domain-containing protein [Bdellovibrionales bacterium]